ncbi:MAG TPA: hypothetical protein VED01_22515 [Burkholderiales bacterium]|nr:hypothetical protein [Burkholderiales bacterium]
MTELRTDFRLLGGRDYVNAGSLLNAFLHALDAEGARGVRITRLKAQRTARANGRLLLSGEGAIADAEHAHCTFAATAGNAQWRGAYFDEGQPIARGPAPEYTVDGVSASGFGGRCTISPRGRDGLVFDIIQANKRFHELAAAGAQTSVRFGYLESWMPPIADTAFDATLEADNLITRKAASGVLTVNRITYRPAGAAPVTLLLCFEMEIGGGTPA